MDNKINLSNFEDLENTPQDLEQKFITADDIENLPSISDFELNEIDISFLSDFITTKEDIMDKDINMDDYDYTNHYNINIFKNKFPGLDDNIYDLIVKDANKKLDENIKNMVIINEKLKNLDV